VGCVRVPTIVFSVAALLATSALGAGREWPQWRGPRRDGVSRERGLMRKWPSGGPKLVWRAKGIGLGCAPVAIADGRIYTAGNIGDETVVVALDLEGRILWKVPNGPAWKRGDPGVRGCPTIEKGWVYHESPMGRVVCIDPGTQMVIWSVDILEKFGGRNIQWGLSESLLIDGGKVIACPGGDAAGMVALNSKTGETVWVCEELGDRPGYASPIVFTFKGLRQIVTMTATAAVGVHARTGKLLWRHEHKTANDANIPTPIFHPKGYVFITSGYNSGSELLKLFVKGSQAKVEPFWQVKGLDNDHGGVLMVNDYLYGSTHRGEWVCLDIKTGKPTYKEEGIGKGSVTYADGHLYILNEQGTVALVSASPKAHTVISKFPIPVAAANYSRRPSSAHPVVCNGRLYIRYDDELFCYMVD